MSLVGFDVAVVVVTTEAVGLAVAVVGGVHLMVAVGGGRVVAVADGRADTTAEGTSEVPVAVSVAMGGGGVVSIGVVALVVAVPARLGPSVLSERITTAAIAPPNTKSSSAPSASATVEGFFFAGAGATPGTGVGARGSEGRDAAELRSVGVGARGSVAGGGIEGGNPTVGSVRRPAAREIEVVRSAVTRARLGANGKRAIASSAVFW